MDDAGAMDSVDGAAAPPSTGYPAAAAGAAIVGLALIWFTVVFVVLGNSFTDAIGETAGGVLAVLVVVSVIGAVRRSRRD